LFFSLFFFLIVFDMIFSQNVLWRF
jgi:hypothetical protein